MHQRNHNASVIEQLRSHRSIRHYRESEVPDEDVRLAVECGQRASTSSNIQAYCLIRIRNPERRERLIELTGGQEKVARCGAFFVVCGDLRRHILCAERAGEPFDVSLEAFLLAVVDASLFVQNVALAFESMGYGMCYIGGLRNELPEVDRMLNLPDGVLPLFGLCVGLPDENPDLKPRLATDAVLFDEAYPDDDAMRSRLDEYDQRCRDYYRERTGRERDWSSVMAKKFSRPARTHLAAYYRSKRASFD